MRTVVGRRSPHNFFCGPAHTRYEGLPVTDDRESGIDFGDLDEDLETESYPLTTDELLAEYGDRKVSYADGSESVAELLGPLNDTYDSVEQVRQAIFNMVSEGAEGRENYSDRGTSHQNEGYDQESL